MPPVIDKGHRALHGFFLNGFFLNGFFLNGSLHWALHQSCFRLQRAQPITITELPKWPLPGRTWPRLARDGLEPQP